MTPAEKQEVIWMFLDQGLSYKEIAERTGIPYGTVYMHAKRKREHDEADMTGDNSDLKFIKFYGCRFFYTFF